MIRGGDIEQWPGTQGRRHGSPQRHLKGETSGNQEDCSCSLVCGVPCRSSWPTCSPARHSVLPPRLPASPASSRCLQPDNFSSQVLPLITTWPLPGGSLCSHSQGKKSDGTAAPFVAGQLVLCILAMCSSLSQSTPAWRTESFGIF